MNYLESLKGLWKHKINRQIIIATSVYVLLILVLGNRYDYLEYEKQWNFYLNGANPWENGNAYGPLHNIMAFFYEINHKLPRLIFSLSSVLASIFLIKKINSSALDEKVKKASFYLLLFNPIIWIMFVVNGCNDGLIGFLFLFGVVFYDRKKYISSAFLLSLAILYKFIPIFILPVLFINNRTINWKFSISSLLFLILGFGTSFYLWGEKMFNPILFNAGRESKILSIFRYLRGDYSILKVIDIQNIDYLSTYLVVGSVILVFICQLIYKWNWLLSVIITLLSVHLFYLVGHFQFYISLYLIMFYYLYKIGSYEKKSTIRKVVVLLYWIAGTTLLYGITEGFYNHFSVLREVIGLPHFLVLLIALVALIPIKKQHTLE